MSTTGPISALKGWHPGEVYVQQMMHLPGRVSITAVMPTLPEQHRLFHSTRLHFLPVTTLDARGRPWGSILTARNGAPEFIHSPSSTALEINAHVWPGDPIVENLAMIRAGVKEPRTLLGGIGIEVSTRRRNKIAGFINEASLKQKDLSLKLTVNQALGLCPKYINVRKVHPHPETNPRVIYEKPDMNEGERLPNEVIDLIHTADTAYISTSYVASPENKNDYPSHLGANHRGGRPGFIRVRPSNGRTLILPNYAGNRLMSSLGNIHITSLASLVFPFFNDGTVLYLTGTAENLFGAPAREIMPGGNVVTAITVTGYVLVRDALPVRELPGTGAERSPYSPPVRYLAEETPPSDSYTDVSLTFVSAVVHNDTLATFTMDASRPVKINPSQNAVLDLSHFMRQQSHALIDWTEDASTENDDCVRTWTVSIYPTPEHPCRFAITMRSIKGGLITPILYDIARKQGGADPFQRSLDLTPLGIRVGLRGIGGDLPVPEAVAACDGGRRLLWIAGGIGLTPFIGLTRYVAQLAARTYGMWDVVLALSTREPEVMLGLIGEAMESLAGMEKPVELEFVIHLFAPSPPKEEGLVPRFVNVVYHEGRVPEDGSFFKSVNAKDRESHICGPLPFVTPAMAALKNAEVDLEKVKRERFTY